MEYRTLGKTGLEVSAVGIGCWQMARDGSWGTGGSDEESIATIHHAETLGVNLLDTSASYGRGRSEEVLGRALQGRRDRYIVATKVKPGSDSDADEETAWRGIAAICEGSLKRLQTDYIDVLQLHRDPPEPVMPAVMETLADLKSQGKIRWSGISSNNTKVIGKLLALGELAVVQVGYNLINRGGESALVQAQAENLGTLIRMPMASGALTGKYFETQDRLTGEDLRKGRFMTERGMAALDRLSELLFLTEGDRRTMVQAALRFVLDTDGVTTVIPGARDRQQLEEVAATVDVPPLTPAERRRAMLIAGEIGSISSLGIIQG